jgi:hypothetical protein
MSDTSAFGFGQFVPGFDFLQNLSKNAAKAQPAAGMPGMGSWVAPTLSIEDIDKRIQELKSVLFWLEQNTTALKATIQAMEVQKMTLTTLQSMNVNMADLAKAFTVKPPAEAAASSAAATAPEAATPAAPKPSLFKPKPAAPEPAQPEPTRAAHSQPEAPSDAAPDSSDSAAAKPAVDPMQWWGALTQQFQGIAAAALKDVAAESMKAGVSAKNGQAAASAARRKSAKASRGAAAAPAQRGAVAKGVDQNAQAAKVPAKSARKASAKASVKTASAPRKASSK